MTATVVGSQLNFSVDEGAQRQLVYTLQNPDGSLQNLTGITFEFVVEDVGFTQTFKILSTDVSNPNGSVVVNLGASTVTLTLNPVATNAIFTNRGGYSFWALWAQPGALTAYTVLTGQITPNRVAQP